MQRSPADPLVACTDQRIDGLVEIGVRHDDHMVLRSAERLNAFLMQRTLLMDIVSNRSRADKGDCCDVGVLDQCIDSFPTPR